MKDNTDEVSIDSLLEVCAGAYSHRTINGYRADLHIFREWCLIHNLRWLPASPEIIASFVDDQISRHRISTIKRRLCAISFVHRLKEFSQPTGHHMVGLAVRRAARLKARRPKQVRGLTQDILSKIVAACPDKPAGLRDAALLSVGYDTLCRSSELALMEVNLVEFHPAGTASVLIPRSKSDRAGDGRVAYLSCTTAQRLKRWLIAASIDDGPLFRSLHLGRVYSSGLATSSIRRLIKRATRRARLDPLMVAGLSGHSMRVGAAQDMMAAGFDALAIMHAGGWKSANVVLRYVEHTQTRELHARRWALLEGAIAGPVAVSYAALGSNKRR